MTNDEIAKANVRVQRQWEGAQFAVKNGKQIWTVWHPWLSTYDSDYIVAQIMEEEGKEKLWIRNGS